MKLGLGLGLSVQKCSPDGPAGIPPFNTGVFPNAPATNAPAPNVGNTVEAGAGVWSGTAPLTYTYQWRRDGVSISGAAGSGSSTQYVLTEDDLGAMVLCRFTATNAYGSYSASTDAVGPVTEADPLLNGLQAYWSFDDSSGADSSGNFSDLSLSGASYSLPGKIGAACLSNGSGSSSSLNVSSDEWTVAAWFRTAAVSIVGYHPTVEWSGAARFGLLSDGSTSAFAGDEFLDQILSTALSANTWYHVALVSDGAGTRTLYLNGAAVGSGSLASIPSLAFQNVTVHTDQGSGDSSGAYRVDEIAIYDRALSPSELTALSLENPTA